mmetsp:Transcript_21932/g.49942  ORF Transcript_21932/g.49942 Transcript_21932/m.49942 type:complete len:215 (-) Transcript_21932:433-1077(-)
MKIGAVFGLPRCIPSGSMAAKNVAASSSTGRSCTGLPSYTRGTPCGSYGGGNDTPACSIWLHCAPSGGSSTVHHMNAFMALPSRSTLLISFFFGVFFAAVPFAFFVRLPDVTASGTTLRFFEADDDRTASGRNFLEDDRTASGRTFFEDDDLGDLPFWLDDLLGVVLLLLFFFIRRSFRSFNTERGRSSSKSESILFHSLFFSRPTDAVCDGKI